MTKTIISGAVKPLLIMPEKADARIQKAKRKSFSLSPELFQ
ncbi:hypothetical protein [Parasutterella muris]|nr:hypothetical protein [Parasutterella muris]